MVIRAMLFFSNDCMTGTVAECSPPMTIGNLPSLMTGPAANLTSSNMSSGRMKSSQFP